MFIFTRSRAADGVSTAGRTRNVNACDSLDISMCMSLLRPKAEQDHDRVNVNACHNTSHNYIPQLLAHESNMAVDLGGELWGDMHWCWLCMSETDLRASSLVIIKVEVYDIPHLFATAVYIPVMPVKRQGSPNPAHQPCHRAAVQIHTEQSA